MEKIDVDFARQIFPFFIFFERVLSRGREIFSFPIVNGYGYFLRRFVCRYDGIDTSTGTLARPLFVEFFDNWNNRARQIVPTPLPLVSTPNNGGGVEHEIQSMTPHTFTLKTPKTSEKILNHYHPYLDVIRFAITGGGVAVKTYFGLVYPSIEIMLDGYFVPEESLEMWGKKEKAKDLKRLAPPKKTKFIRI